jgi:hypothetical protein
MISIREGGIVPRPPRENPPIVPPRQTEDIEVDAIEVDAIEEDLTETPRSQNWERHELVVADPFIRLKVSSSFPHFPLDRSLTKQKECYL